jgi:hypothetical protein
MPKMRQALLVCLIVAIAVVIGLVRSRSRQAIPSVRVTASAQTGDHLLVKQRVDVPPPTAEGPGKVEICGHGKVSIDDSSAVAQYVGALTQGAGVRWLSALQDSGDLRARVAGLLLEGKITGGGPIVPPTEQTRDAVVQLAVGVDDPAVYAMAVSMCGIDRGIPADTACQQISLQRWAQIDADNAVPWLLLAGKAQEGHDSAAAANAFRQATKAHQYDAYNDSLYSFAEPEMPPDATPLERSYLATEVIGVESTLRSPYGPTTRRCSADAVQDPDIRQQCNALAELLVNHGTSLIDFSVGRNIGARVGWPKERVDGLALEQYALTQAIIEVTPSDNDNLWTCDSVRRLNAYMVQRARLGELGAGRDILERSGETLQALAQRHLQFIEKLQREAPKQQQGKPSESAP